jgi:hypothetical protein
LPQQNIRDKLKIKAKRIFLFCFRRTQKKRSKIHFQLRKFSENNPIRFDFI